METLPASQSVKEPQRRLGRPPARNKKVTRSVRIPAEVDAFLTNYGHEHGLLIGDVITEAIIHFRVKSTPSNARRVRAAAV